jgi:tetratricopeptide (TPR) repeat protein
LWWRGDRRQCDRDDHHWRRGDVFELFEETEARDRTMKQRLCFAAALGILIGSPASAQLVGTRSVEATGCAAAVGGDVRDSSISIVCGMPLDQVVELVRLAASSQAGDRAELLIRLSALIPKSSQIRVEAIAKFFQLLGEVPVDEDQLPNRFAQIAEEHRRLIEDVKNLHVDDPEVRALREQAAASLEIADHATARAKLEQARSIVRGKREMLARVLVDQQREEAGLVNEQARVEAARLAYDEAARLFHEAADLLPTNDAATRSQYLVEEAHAWSAKAERLGDYPALERAIDVSRSALHSVSPLEYPVESARIQSSLGLALLRLAEREPGTIHIEEAVFVLRQTLQVLTRAQAPQFWAQIQNNLGFALLRLGERERGTAHIEEAAAAFRLALEVQSADAWLIRTNIGHALVQLGARESGKSHLEEAIAVLRLSLEEQTRRGIPRYFATQDNLGWALLYLANREEGTVLFADAIAAFRVGLESAPRERVPIRWAMVQCSLGYALASLGARETGTTHLEEAVAAFDASLDVLTPAQVRPLAEQARAAKARTSALLANRQLNTNAGESPPK